MTDNLCRACANELSAEKVDANEIVEVHDDEYSYSQIFLILTGQILKSSEPSGFCNCCAASLISFMQFRIQCQQFTAWFGGLLSEKPLMFELKKEEVIFNTAQPVEIEADEEEEEEGDSIFIEVDEKPDPIVEEEFVDEVEVRYSNMEYLDDEQTQNADESTLKCDLCSDVFYGAEEYITHLRSAHASSSDTFFFCKNDETEMTGSPVPTKMVTVIDSGEYKCDYCSKTSTSKQALSFHMKIHTKPNHCELCGASFSASTKLKIHMEQMHGFGEVLQCAQCDYQTRTKIYMTKHINLRHEGKRQKNYTCPECGLKFYSPHNLEDHRRRHSDAKNFHCTRCTSSFKTKKSLNAHQAVHMEYKYECPVCVKSFLTNQQLRSHVQRHHKEYELPPKGTILRKDYQPTWIKSIDNSN